MERPGAVTPLVLSLFSGIDLLGRRFEAEGFCVVRGLDIIWGGDIITRRVTERAHLQPGRSQNEALTGSLSYTLYARMSTLTAKVFQSGNSRAIRLPGQLRAKPGQVFEIEPFNGGFRLVDPAERTRRRKAMRKLLKMPTLKADWPRP
jgi:antitoxin component of MazEF toxin-antitoxin module